MELKCVLPMLLLRITGKIVVNLREERFEDELFVFWTEFEEEKFEKELLILTIDYF